MDHFDYSQFLEDDLDIEEVNRLFAEHSPSSGDDFEDIFMARNEGHEPALYSGILRENCIPHVFCPAAKIKEYKMANSRQFLSPCFYCACANPW